jgi:hypothetical protein
LAGSTRRCAKPATRHGQTDRRCFAHRRAQAAQQRRREGGDREGRIPEDSKAKPAKLRHKDRGARWTVKFSKAKPKADGTVAAVDIAIPVFG